MRLKATSQVIIDPISRRVLGKPEAKMRRKPLQCLCMDVLLLTVKLLLINCLNLFRTTVSRPSQPRFICPFVVVELFYAHRITQRLNSGRKKNTVSHTPKVNSIFRAILSGAISATESILFSHKKGRTVPVETRGKSDPEHTQC